MQCRLRGLSLPATYTEKDEFDCVRTFSCLLCPEALNTVKELEEHVVERNCYRWIIFSYKTSKISHNSFQVSIGHWRRLGKLFVHGQLRQTFLPEAEQDFQVPELMERNHPHILLFNFISPQVQDDFCANCLEDGKKMPAVGLCTNCRELMCRFLNLEFSIVNFQP